MATNFQNLNSVKKGNIGERLVNAWLVQQGYVPYVPAADGRHPFDKLVASSDKKKIFIAEVKTKPARSFYPDTGINITHYQDYKFIEEKHNLEVFIFFVDEDKKSIYGNWLKELERPRRIQIYPFEYPRREPPIIYFPLEAMIDVADIPLADVEKIKDLSGRNKSYIPSLIVEQK